MTSIKMKKKRPHFHSSALLFRVPFLQNHSTYSEFAKTCTIFSLLPAALLSLITAASELKILLFCIASVLLPHAEPSQFLHVCAAVFLLITSYSRPRVFINPRPPYVHCRINFYQKPHVAAGCAPLP